MNRLKSENNSALRDKQNMNIFKVTSSLQKYFLKTALCCTQYNAAESMENGLFSPEGTGYKYNVIVSYPFKTSLSLRGAASCQALQLYSISNLPRSQHLRSHSLSYQVATVGRDKRPANAVKPSLEHSRPNPEKSLIPPYRNNTTEARALHSQNHQLKKNIHWQKYHLKMSILQKPWQDVNNFLFTETSKHHMTLHLLAQQIGKNKNHYI